MDARFFYSLFICLILACSVAATAQQNVVVNFAPSDPTLGPFPTDFLTVDDATQKTGHSIHLPMPECAAQPSACTEVSLLNQLDGFALSPRIAVNFSGAIDASTLSVGIVIVWLDNLTTDEPGLGPVGQITAINQVIFDPTTNTAYAKPNGPLDQHRRYALLVTDAVLDTSGTPVAADPKFSQCVQTPANAYCAGLQQTLSTLTTASTGPDRWCGDLYDLERDRVAGVRAGSSPPGALGVPVVRSLGKDRWTLRDCP
jgi:hypothetical protein